MDQLRKDYIPEKRYPMKKYESVIGGINLKKKSGCEKSRKN